MYIHSTPYTVQPFAWPRPDISLNPANRGSNPDNARPYYTLAGVDPIPQQPFDRRGRNGYQYGGAAANMTTGYVSRRGGPYYAAPNS